MKEFNLKILVTVLSSIVFSLIFILLAFILPSKNNQTKFEKKADNVLEEVSRSMNK